MAKGRPLLTPVTQAEKSAGELLDQLKSPEPRTRYAARIELRARATADVLAALKHWLAGLNAGDPEHDRFLCEALWVQQGFHAVDPALVRTILSTKSPDARAAAVHVVSDERERLSQAFEIIKPMAIDAHPRVRLEAIRALSFFPTKESAMAVLEATKLPMDYWVEYTLDATLGALRDAWKPLLDQPEALAAANPAASKFLQEFAAQDGPGGAAIKPMRELLDPATAQPRKNRLMGELAKMKGNPSNGRAVFLRICIACHKLGDQGIEYGPVIHDVGARLKPVELVESIIEPNAKLDPRYQVTNIETRDGQAMTGFIVRDDPQSLTLRIAGGIEQTFQKSTLKKHETVAASSMPEGLANAISAPEFIDLITFLTTQKGK